MITPASTCGQCLREGRVSSDQMNHSTAQRSGVFLRKAIRFYCGCGNEWLVDGEEADTHARFLERAGIR